MKLGIILIAFFFGCAATAFIRVAPTNANNESNDLVAVSQKFALSETEQETQEQVLDVVEEAFGETADGRPVKKFICTNDNGYVLEMMDYGAVSYTHLTLPTICSV